MGGECEEFSNDILRVLLSICFSFCQFYSGVADKKHIF